MDLTAADDIKTSRRVMEIQWEEDPEFSRTYHFLYRELDATSGAPAKNSETQSSSDETRRRLRPRLVDLQYLKSDEVTHIVCVLESTLAQEIAKVSYCNWSRIDDVNEDCVGGCDVTRTACSRRTFARAKPEKRR